MALTLWHLPRCSTSRMTLALLQEHGVEPELRLYLQDPPSREELTALLKRLKLKPSGLIRRKEPLYAELGLTDKSEARQLTAMLKNPVLIERPILIAGDRAALGRPPEAVLAILP